ncbi:hypothetical protein CJF31_00000476 [Rutstroemia sp. NJR-2017a BVV2]|nr:hypothetical protein CJF31_00000476 [Rutstroemia sp. NJR-2017a BVV2]
MQTRPRS